MILPTVYGKKIRGDGIEIHNEREKVLGKYIDHKLSFEQHIDQLCNKTIQKASALTRMASLMTFEQKLIMCAFIKSHISYCHVRWMFHSRTLNNRINRTHERALRTMISILPTKSF